MILGKSIYQVNLSYIEKLLSKHDIRLSDHLLYLAYDIIISSMRVNQRSFHNEVEYEFLKVGFVDNEYFKEDMLQLTNELYTYLVKVFGNNILNISLIKKDGVICCVDIRYTGVHSNEIPY